MSKVEHWLGRTEHDVAVECDKILKERGMDKLFGLMGPNVKIVQKSGTAQEREENAYKLLEKARWPNGPICPHCGYKESIYFLKPKTGVRYTHRKSPTYRRLWKCGRCRKQFSVLVGTIYEGSHIPIWKWIMAVRYVRQDPKANPYRLSKLIDVNYSGSARKMFKKIKHARNL